MSRFEERLAAIQTINRFMGNLALRYKNDDMEKLWEALELMTARYGDIFVAAAINKNAAEAELALFRYGKAHWPEVIDIKKSVDPDPDPQEASWIYVDPKPHNILKKIGLAFGIGIFVMALILIMCSQAAVRRSDEILSRTAVYMDLGR